MIIKIFRKELLLLSFHIFFCIAAKAQLIRPSPTFDISNFLAENLKYPEEARKNNKEGKVQIKFLVNEAGYIDSILL